MTLQIRKTKITRDSPPFIIAEIGVNHDGNPKIALQLLHAAKKAGAHAVKFQLFDADLLLSNQAALVAYQKKSAKSAADLLRPLQLSPQQLAPLIKKAHALHLAAIVTPFSVELVAPCKKIGVDAIKLASPDLVHRPLLEAAVKTRLPLILSTGAATLPEIERTLGWLHHLRAVDRTILLHCVSSYPTPDHLATLAAITVLRTRFPELPIGYSDHTTTTLTAALAVAAGATVLEKHLTLSRKRKGPDHAASLEPKQFAQYVAYANQSFPMRGPYEKIVQPLEQPVRQQTRQSLTTTRPLPAGTTLTRTMLTFKRPGTGIPAANLPQTLGQTLNKPLPPNTTLAPADLA